MSRILIVDDNAQNLYLLEVLLRTNGYEVYQAANGVEALASARKNPPDLLITDILMPSMDGFSLCREWKKDKLLQDIPLIFYTATYTDKKDEKFALSIGADRFIIKPQDPDELLANVKDVLKTGKSKGQKSIKEQPVPKENEYYKGYNEALVRKLEKKMLQLEKSNKFLNSLYQISCDLVKIKNLQDILRKVVSAISEVIGYQKVAYFQYDAQSNALSLLETSGFSENALVELQDKLNSTSKKALSLPALVARNRETINITDTSSDQRWESFDTSTKSALFIPVQYEQDLLGVLGLFSSDVDAFTGDENNIIALTNSLAISIVNKRAEERIIDFNLELEDRIQERTFQLQSSNSDLEAFAYSVSHDLRAPLRAIQGYSKILLEEYKKQLDAEGARILDIVCQNTQRMDKFITDLLTLSKVSLREKNYSSISMSEIVAEVIKEIREPDVEKAVTLEVAPLPEVYADPILIRQVWVNLVMNAVKYSNIRTEPKITISFKDEDDFHLFMIEDNGIGFGQELSQTLFQPFQRLYSEDQFEGTGIGLTIVKRIVERHGGKVWAEGKKNQGAKFFFTIPKKIQYT